MLKHYTDIVNDRQQSLDHQTDDLISATILYWKDHAGMELSQENARDFIKNITGYFTFLHAWDWKEEQISPDEFMSRIGIKKTTYSEWKKSGRLVRIRHYVQAGGKTIIFWSMKLLRELDDLYQEPPKEEQPIGNDALKTPRKRCAINLNY